MTDGIYIVNYTGQEGFGSAALVFRQGEIFGVDVAGSDYSGTYTSNDNGITGEINLLVPAGTVLVTGAPPQANAYTIPIPFNIPSEIEDQQTVQIQVQLPTGPVNANIKKVKSIAA